MTTVLVVLTGAEADDETALKARFRSTQLSYVRKNYRRSVGLKKSLCSFSMAFLYGVVLTVLGADDLIREGDKPSHSTVDEIEDQLGQLSSGPTGWESVRLNQPRQKRAPALTGGY